MKSKTSFFNKTVFKKNLTRFAPAWGLYILCLTLGTLLLYSNGGTMTQWHFAANMAEMPQIMSLINLIYAPVVVQLLFGDLYSSRMCNALHAMPIRRESWFFTNIVSGLFFSVIPNLVMTLLATSLSAGSIIQNAWQIPWLVLAASTLEFVCFFGMALFSAMCAGNRLGMVLIYGLLNAGAFIAYWLVDTVYTPMLYGVVTPDALAEALIPMANMTDNAFISTEYSLVDLLELFGEDLKGAASSFSIVPETWLNVFIWAGAGVVFALIGLVLYKKRDLECAGDAMAFHILEPAFQVLGSVVCAAAAQFFLNTFVGTAGCNYLVLAAGLVVGWFACRMLIERSTRVFRLRDWIGLGSLTAVLVISLFLTHMDILGIAAWQPRAEDVKSVTLSNSFGYELTDKEDIQKILNLQAEALDTRLEVSGAYIRDENGQWVHFTGVKSSEELWELDDIDSRYAFHTSITYTLENGKQIRRNYSLWADGQAGDDAREILSRWEVVNSDYVYANGKKTEDMVLDMVLDTFDALYVEGFDKAAEDIDRAMAEDLVAAIRADCDAGNMAQVRYLHSGHFRMPYPEKEGEYYYRTSLQVNLEGKNCGWYIDVYPECENTLSWLREHDLLKYDIQENSLCFC